MIFLRCGDPHATLECNVKGKLCQQTSPDYDVAIQFINDYIIFLNNSKSEVEVINWLATRNDLSNRFKEQVIEMLTEAYDENPLFGLGFDPIFDAQDHPEKFELESTESEYLVLKGVDWSSFKLTMRLKFENGKWVVDGAGIINMPDDKRIKR